MSDASVRALLDRWQQDVSNLYAANEDEGHAVAAIARAARAEEIWRCAQELRAALDAPETTPDAPTSIADDHGRTWDPHPFAQSRAVDNIRVCICGQPPDHYIHAPETALDAPTGGED